MQYIEVQVESPLDFVEILIAELGQLEFESFLENEKGFSAYIQEEFFREEDIKEIFGRYQDQVKLNYTSLRLEKQNWNEEWEKNYEPIFVLDQCVVKSSFHVIEKKYPYQILINPKMSFGTGHHATTMLMMENQLETDHQGKIVLDAGSGTGILAIFASFLGAKFVDAYDIEEWAYENAVENADMNHIKNMKVQLGTIHTVQLSEKYDVILANINRNVLLEEIPFYAKYIAEKGVLIVSGFYTEDEQAITSIAIAQGFKKTMRKEKDNWLSIIFQK